MVGIIRKALGQSKKRYFHVDEREIEVAGESHYQNTLWSIVGKPLGDDAPFWGGYATLVPDPKNEHDPNAVRVEINGKVVGHLEAKLAARVQKPILSIAPFITVAAMTKGGFVGKDGTRASLGITLRFNPNAVITESK